jgi:hypothetical protein
LEFAISSSTFLFLFNPFQGRFDGDILIVIVPYRNRRAAFQKLIATISIVLILPSVLFLITFVYLVGQYLANQNKKVNKKDD